MLYALLLLTRFNCTSDALEGSTLHDAIYTETLLMAQYDDADLYAEFIPSVQGEFAGVPAWAVWVFAGCFFIICAVLLLDYCVIRRNALGNTCCARARQKRNTGNAAHQKRSTNMLLNKLNRQPQAWDSEV